MFPIIVWLGGAIIGTLAVSAVVEAFWDEIMAWVEKVIPGLVMMVRGVTTGNLEIIKEGWNYIKKVILYEKRGDDYYKHEKSEKISSNDVPDEIRKELELKGKVAQPLEVQI